MKHLLLKLFLIVVVISQISAQSVYLPLDHWAYDFLERMEAKQVISGLRDGSRPFTREQVVRFIIDIDRFLQTQPGILSKVEKRILERLKGEFWHELQNQKIMIQTKEREPHFYHWHNQSGHLYFDVLSGGGSTLKSGEVDQKEREIHSAFYGGILRGSLWGLAIYSDNRIFTEWGSRTYTQHYNASEGYPISTSDSSRATWDASVSYLGLTWKGIQCQFGRDRLKWGPAYWGGLMLSGLAPDYDLLKISAQFGASVFTWIHGELRSDFSHKWFSGHRLEITVSRGVDIGLHELVIYGRRGLEVVYLNPIIPYLFAEHTLGDRDNVSLGFDFEINRVRNMQFYGELFIDDLFEPWDIFSNFWGNKLAFTLGGQWVDPVGLNNMEIRCEYSRIEPYVYTHKDSVNVFEHYDSGLGHFLQPNSDGLFLLAGYRPLLSLNTAIEFRSIRHGEGDRRKPHQEEEGTEKFFLKGIVERRRQIGILVEWEMIRDLWLWTEWSGIWTKHFQRIQNNNKKWNEWSFSVNLNW